METTEDYEVSLFMFPPAIKNPLNKLWFKFSLILGSLISQMGMEQSSGRPTLRKRANRTQKVAPEEESSLANRRIQKLDLYPRNLGRRHDE